MANRGRPGRRRGLLPGVSVLPLQGLAVVTQHGWWWHFFHDPMDENWWPIVAMVLLVPAYFVLFWWRPWKRK